jgi:ATP-dependent DNA ligase
LSSRVGLDRKTFNPFERGEIGPDLFRAACNMGLEGLLSKRRDRPYQAGQSKHWVKVKNRKHPAIDRVMEEAIRAFTHKSARQCPPYPSEADII